MKSLMHQALGSDWERLPAPLKAHYQFGPNVDLGHMDIEFPLWIKPYLWLLHKLGALLAKSGSQIPTRVEKHVVADRQYWRRTMRFPDGAEIRFDSFWVPGKNNHLIEFVNPVMGLEMAPRLEGDELHYDGVRYVIKLGPLTFGLPEWLVLGHTTIVERKHGEDGFAMDFRLTHPLAGQVFRYSGIFTTQRNAIATQMPR